MAGGLIWRGAIKALGRGLWRRCRVSACYSIMSSIGDFTVESSNIDVRSGLQLTRRRRAFGADARFFPPPLASPLSGTRAHQQIPLVSHRRQKADRRPALTQAVTCCPSLDILTSAVWVTAASSRIADPIGVWVSV